MTESQECLVCGQALEYLVRQEPMTCSFCGKTFLSNARCRNGHYVCDTCHEKQGIIEIMDICRQEKSKNPAEILQKMMKNPYIYMHGPEHHIMVGASLLTAWHNAGGAVDFPAALEEMKDREQLGFRAESAVCGEPAAPLSAQGYASVSSHRQIPFPLRPGGWETV